MRSNVLGASFMLTNICLGTTIFTFAVKAKSFGLVWFLLCCILVALVNYWTITRGVIASSKCPDVDDFSEINVLFSFDFSFIWKIHSISLL